MNNINTNTILRIGFGIFFLIWGAERILRTDQWASTQLLGNFYGSAGTINALVLSLGIVQVLMALAFFTNFKVRIAAAMALVFIGSSLIVTIIPLLTYLVKGGTAIPYILFTDHFPLLGGAWVVFATSESLVTKPKTSENNRLEAALG